ncbi:MAG: CBS domain-containing protein, partial [Bradyrhizobium sp.]
GDFSMMGPLLIATSTAYAVTVLLLKRSILTEKISRRGRHVIREYSVDPFDLMLVNEVMVHKVDTLPAAMSVDQAVAYFSTAAQHKSYPLVDANGQVVGMVARADVLRWNGEKSHGDETLFDKVSDHSLTVGFADEPVSSLANRMVQADISRVPIVERGTTQKLIGLVSRKDLLRILATVRSSEISRAAFFGRQAAAKSGDEASASAVES